MTAVGRWRSRRRAVRRDGQLPEALERMASAVRAGSSVGGALCEVAGDVPAPLAEDLAPVAAALAGGAGLDAAIGLWVTSAGAAPDVALAVTALGLGGQAGGEVARALDRVAATLRERRELRAEVRALATQARASAGLLIVAPIGFAALVSTIEPDVALFLLGSPLGFACLAAGFGLDVLGAIWMWRIVEGAS